MNKKPHTSEITNFLKELDDTIQPDSPSRQAETKKYKAINEKRDNAEIENKESKLWKGF